MATYNSTVIANLSTIGYNDISSDTFLLMSQPTDRGVYSYKFTVDTLSTALTTAFTNVPANTEHETFNPTGIWQITEAGKLNVKFNSAINPLVKKNLAVNLGYVYKAYIKQLEELSTMYFAGGSLKDFSIRNGFTTIHDEMFIPSYVGQIIVSSKLVTETDLKNKYGKDTAWKKISGRLLVGVGQIGKNADNRLGKTEDLTIPRSKIMGGSPYVSIGDFVPMHSHCMANGTWEDNGIRATCDGDFLSMHNDVRGTLGFGEFPMASYNFFVFQCPKTGEKMTDTDDSDTSDDDDSSSLSAEGQVNDYKGMLAYADGLLHDTHGKQHRAKWFLVGPLGEYRKKTQDYFKTFTYKVAGDFANSGTAPENVALLPTVPLAMVYYIWERIE